MPVRPVESGSAGPLRLLRAPCRLLWVWSLREWSSSPGFLLLIALISEDCSYLPIYAGRAGQSMMIALHVAVQKCACQLVLQIGTLTRKEDDFSQERCPFFVDGAECRPHLRKSRHAGHSFWCARRASNAAWNTFSNASDSSSCKNAAYCCSLIRRSLHKLSNSCSVSQFISSPESKRAAIRRPHDAACCVACLLLFTSGLERSRRNRPCYLWRRAI